MSNLSSKIDQGGVAPHLRFLKPMLLLELLAHKTLLSIPQTHLNVKFILRKLSKNVNFAELPFTVILSILQTHTNVKFTFKFQRIYGISSHRLHNVEFNDTTKYKECQIYFQKFPPPKKLPT